MAQPKEVQPENSEPHHKRTTEELGNAKGRQASSVGPACLPASSTLPVSVESQLGSSQVCC